MRFKLHPSFSDKHSFLLNIEEHFLKSDASIHKARNEIKIIDGFVVKAFKIPHIINKFAYAYLRDSKAKKSYLNALKIAQFTPKPLGYIEFFSFGLLEKSYFISEKFDYDFTIREPLEDTNFTDRESIFKALAQFTYDLHQEGILHKDYSPGNILIKKTSIGYDFKIVDINRMKFITLTRKKRLSNFTKLFAEDEDLKTIVYAYATLVNFSQEEAYQEALLPSQKHRKALLKKWAKKR